MLSSTLFIPKIVDDGVESNINSDIMNVDDGVHIEYQNDG